MIAWTIAGSDSGGGAGIQADLKTFHALGVHGCSILTALTAQNTQSVSLVEFPSMEMIDAQFSALAEDLPPKAVKTGMLGRADIIRQVAQRLAGLDCRIVCDPVMVATSGGVLLEDDARDALVKSLFPLVHVLTPNLPEAEALCGFSISDAVTTEAAGRRMLDMGVGGVLIKGGHREAGDCLDYWCAPERSFWLRGERLDTPHTHGSGCTLAAAITACLARGIEVEDALVLGKAFVTAAIRAGGRVGGGFRPVHPTGWPDNPRDIPRLLPEPPSAAPLPAFPSTGPEPLGFYPIVDRAAWLERLLPLGVTTVQLRIKDLHGQSLEDEVIHAIDLARASGARLFINDYWKLALKHRAYGVHLGQEDLADADLPALARAGIRLGLSTHSHTELARALAAKPSYLALGPIYETTIKKMPFAPQGLQRLTEWRRLTDVPLVAIGGINLKRAEGVLAAGADSIAVITALTQAPNPEDATRAFLAIHEAVAPKFT